MALIALLGPQRHQANLGSVLGHLGIGGPVALVSAGWQEREGETGDLARQLDRPVIDLQLYGRAERVMADDPNLALAHRDRQQRLEELQRLYRIRLRHALAAAREAADAAVRPSLRLAAEQAAVRALRLVDRQHLRAIRAVHADFEREHRPLERPAVAGQRDELMELLAPARPLLIAGGHVAVLLNRLRLFDLAGLLATRPVVAWSAGAMALAERVVLFHDRPPQGAGDPEVLDQGLGLVQGVVPLPDARVRLRLDDPARVGLFARRFAPATGVTLDEGAALVWRDGSLGCAAGAGRLDANGRVVALA